MYEVIHERSRRGHRRAATVLAAVLLWATAGQVGAAPNRLEVDLFGALSASSLMTGAGVEWYRQPNRLGAGGGVSAWYGPRFGELYGVVRGALILGRFDLHGGFSTTLVEGSADEPSLNYVGPQGPLPHLGFGWRFPMRSGGSGNLAVRTALDVMVSGIATEDVSVDSLGEAIVTSFAVAEVQGIAMAVNAVKLTVGVSWSPNRSPATAELTQDAVTATSDREAADS